VLVGLSLVGDSLGTSQSILVRYRTASCGALLWIGLSCSQPLQSGLHPSIRAAVRPAREAQEDVFRRPLRKPVRFGCVGRAVLGATGIASKSMNRLTLVIVCDVIAFVLISAGLASRIPDFTFAGSVLGLLAFAVSLQWLWSPD
jgi:hypothetical protein